VEFWRQQAESVPPQEQRRVCNKYREETNHYRQLWSLLTSETSNNAEGNLPKVDCVSFEEQMRIEQSVSNEMSKLNKRTAVAALAKAARIKNEFNIHAIMAERQACHFLGKAKIFGNNKDNCRKWDPRYPAVVPGEVFYGEPGRAAMKLMPTSDPPNSGTWERFTNINEGLEKVFYGHDGLLKAVEYGREAKTMGFQCHLVEIGYKGMGGTYCCPSRCKNCDVVKMNDGVRDSSYTDEMRLAILETCNQDDSVVEEESGSEAST